MKRLLATLVLLVTATPVAAQWLALATPGIPRTADGKPDLSAPVPRTADGRPELTGLWRSRGVTGDLRDESKVQAWALSAMAEHESNYYRDGPHMQCLPQGPSYIAGAGGGGGSLRRIVQSPSVIAILNTDLTYRQIFTDDRVLEPDPLPIWQGYSVGRWDGDTLVVESNGFNDKTWLHAEGLGHTERLRITERYRRLDFGHIQVDVTYEDPGTFDSPLQVVVNLEFAADDEILELVCNEASEGGTKHWVGDKTADARATAVEVAPEILAKYVGTYQGIWLDNPTTVEVTLDGGALFLRRNRGEKSQLLAQSETTFVCSTCQWGQPYVFTGEGDGIATEVREVQVSGAWIFKRVQ
ncbi:MAG TPA: hypothetical protein VJA26_11295 [Gammaproteobacteria bacterium]|nr:hypothetical protein [Gammaproteobacteria bacterium]